MYQIGEAAELGKVSTRLLRHYDEIGWGHTEACNQSAERWSKYTKADVGRMKAELAQAHGRLEEVFASGARPDTP